MNKIDEYCKIMNIKQNEILNDPKQEFRFFCYQHIKLSANIKIIKLDYNNINIDQYNELLTSTFFWNLFLGSKIYYLII